MIGKIILGLCIVLAAIIIVSPDAVPIGSIADMILMILSAFLWICIIGIVAIIIIIVVVLILIFSS